MAKSDEIDELTKQVPTDTETITKMITEPISKSGKYGKSFVVFIDMHIVPFPHALSPRFETKKVWNMRWML